MRLHLEVGDNMKKLYIIVALFITATMFVAYQTYSYYFRRMNVNVSSTSSDIKCDAEIQTVASDEKSIYGYSEFKVVVKNTEDNNVTGEPFNYVLTFENETGSDAIFGYNNEFSSDLSITGSLSNDQARTNSHIIQVKSNRGLSETINYKVNLSCTQQN